MAEERRNRESRWEQGAGEEPQVYAVQKDLTGWRFSRRDFLAAAGAAAAVNRECLYACIFRDFRDAYCITVLPVPAGAYFQCHRYLDRVDHAMQYLCHQALVLH